MTRSSPAWTSKSTGCCGGLCPKTKGRSAHKVSHGGGHGRASLHTWSGMSSGLKLTLKLSDPLLEGANVRGGRNTAQRAAIRTFHAAVDASPARLLRVAANLATPTRVARGTLLLHHESATCAKDTHRLPVSHHTPRQSQAAPLRQVSMTHRALSLLHVVVLGCYHNHSGATQSLAPLPYFSCRSGRR